MLTIKKQLTEEEAATLPCFFCGDDETFSFYIKSIKKVACMFCLEDEEVKSFMLMKERQQ